MKKILGVPLIVAVLFIGTTGMINAAVETVKFENPLKAEYGTFSLLVEGVTRTAVTVMMPFVVIYFIYAGFLYVKAQGKAKGLEEANKAIYYSIIGAFILFGAWSFAQIIGKTVASITGIK